MATTAVRETAHVERSRWRSGGYRFLLGLPALAAALFGGHLLITGWFASLHGGSHRFHDLTWGVLEGVLILSGLIGSLWHAERHPAAYQQVIVGLGALAATMALSVAIDVPTIVIGALVVGAGFLHPARDSLTKVGNWHGPSLIVGAAISAPLVWYALQQASLQRNGSMSDAHVEMAHYAGATAVALALAGLSILAASRVPGQPLVATCTAIGLAVLGVASLLWPDLPSSFGGPGGVAALVGAAGIAITGLSTSSGSRRATAMAVSLVAVLLLGACGDDVDDTPEATSDATEAADTETADSDGSGVIEVTGSDYAFEGVPEQVEAGTELTFRNASSEEVHEMVVVRIDDDETRSLDELMELPDKEAEKVTSPVGFLFALPGEEGVNPEDPSGDSAVSLTTPGRYILLCFIPEGADPEVFREAIESDEPGEGPPPTGDGPPHAVLGMVHELTVTK